MCETDMKNNIELLFLHICEL